MEKALRAHNGLEPWDDVYDALRPVLGRSDVGSPAAIGLKPDLDGALAIDYFSGGG